jgi:hypothetical protein
MLVRKTRPTKNECVNSLICEMCEIFGFITLKTSIDILREAGLWFS